MGTRGFIVVKFNNKYYKIYNHFDSYPSELGRKVIDFLKKLKDNNELEQNEECLHKIIEYFVMICKNEVEEGDTDLNIMIEWIYKIDLDQLLLIVACWNTQETFNICLINEDDVIFHEICKMG